MVKFFIFYLKQILQLYRSRRILWRTFGWWKNEKSCYSHYSSNQNKYCRKNIYNFSGRLSNHGFNCSGSKFRYKNMPLKSRTSSIMMDRVVPEIWVSFFFSQIKKIALHFKFNSQFRICFELSRNKQNSASRLDRV